MWISPKKLAELAGIPYRSSVRAVRETHERKNAWRGAHLVVRTIHGRGGAGGDRFEILLTSLPQVLQARWNARAVARDGEAPVGTERIAAGYPWPHAQREAEHLAFSRLPESMQRAARRKAAIVEMFREFDGTETKAGERWREVAREAGCSVPTVRQWVKRCEGFHRADWPMRLKDAYTGRVARARITAEALDVIKAEYLRPTKPHLKPIYRRAKAEAQARGWVIPSYETVKRLVNAEGRAVLAMMREGRDVREQTIYPAHPRDYSTLALHEVWCSDGRKADVFVKWPDGTVGRPIVIAWMEVRSRKILGYYVDQVESAEGVRRSLRQALEHANAVPQNALIDNGMGYAAKMLSGGDATRRRFKQTEGEPPGILPLLGIKARWAQPARGRSKPIESFWRQLAELDKSFPEGAYCGNRPDARPEECEPSKAIAIDKYLADLAAALDAYHDREHRGHAMNGESPRAVYEAMAASAVVTQPTQAQLNLCMLAAKVVRLDRRSGEFRINGNRYWCPDLVKQPTGEDYVARFDPDDATVPVALYLGDKYLLDVPIRARTGFMDSDAAKSHSRAERTLHKLAKARAKAIKQQRQALSWNKSSSSESPPAPSTPPSKIVKLLRPAVDYRKSDGVGGLTREQFRAAVAQGAAALDQQKKPTLTLEEFRAAAARGARMEIEAKAKAKQNG